ncbi:MAG: hypothetical protein N838_00080 [Thiohalocapsa sp. PB-PSB1]|jgi:hypothetical protein|nr:MAG: hypothetical protein N838_12520 [Thiohalocapsa sp. PB-PSB1]QQO52004.1 MAG: hypothetical protein N838_00080 [Thiohalocapsa sp. PB-PSB1]
MAQTSVGLEWIMDHSMQISPGLAAVNSRVSILAEKAQLNQPLGSIGETDD